MTLQMMLVADALGADTLVDHARVDAATRRMRASRELGRQVLIKDTKYGATDHCPSCKSLYILCRQVLNKDSGDAFVSCGVRLWHELEEPEGHTVDELEDVSGCREQMAADCT